jgi:hypothetical protein
VLPGVDWVEDFSVDTLGGSRNFEAESWNSFILFLLKRTVVNVINNLSGILQTHSTSNSIFTSSPAGVDKPDMGIMLLDLLCKHLSVEVRMLWKEGFTETGGESRLWLSDTYFGSSNLGSVSRNEMVHSLVERQS